MNIKWLDGKNADGMYVLEICYSDGTKGYLKDNTQEGIANYYATLYEMPEVTGFIVYNPEGQQTIEVLGMAA
jgi:hypothetical protein